MNKRIKQLADEAEIGKLIHVGGGEWDTKLSDKELKFAKLIINECMDVANSHFESKEPGYPGDKIQEHFGVKY